MSLNPHQLAAAHAPFDQPLKIIAGAGTGKTETLAARYVDLVRGGLAPEQIVLLTFTEDAAAEMRARVMLRLREAGLADADPAALLHLWIATFHGFAMRLLHEHGFAVELPPSPRLLTDDDQQEFWQAAREAIEDEPRLPNGYAPLDHTVYRWDSDETWRHVLTVIGALRRGGGTAAELEPHPQLAAQQTTAFAAHRAQLTPLIEHCFALYSSHLRARGALDYDELLQTAARLLRADPTIAERFAVLMVDEFQDTNRPQLALLQQIQPTLSRTTVVGDPRQAIYGWNSARAESINEFPFRADLTLPPRTLIENYRSEPAIVAVANLALAGSELGRLAALIPAQRRTAQRSPALDGLAVSLHLLPSVEAEARFIAKTIGELHQRGMPYRDLAVLQRSRTQLPALQAAFQAAQIPYVVNGGSGFYLDPAVRLTSALLRLIADPLDRAAWAHLLESPLIGLPPGLIALRGPATDDEQRPAPVLMRWLDDPESFPALPLGRDAVVERLQRFRTLFDAARARWGLLSPAAYLEWLWSAAGMLHTGWSAQPSQPQLVLRRLLRDADEYAAQHPAEGIAGFTALLERRVQEQPRVALPTTPALEAVEIATVHQAKGREWPVVLLFNTALPSLRSGQIESVLWDERWRLVISEAESSRTRAADPLQTLRDDLRRRKRNEERSIWYVALTRAQQRLYILHSGCALHNGAFDDAQAKLARIAAGEALSKTDEAVHFFHELWTQLDAQPALLERDVACRVELDEER
jgi:DNA helicase-2/ATP-dependent DNA helicase PcrA